MHPDGADLGNRTRMSSSWHCLIGCRVKFSWLRCADIVLEVLKYDKMVQCSI